MAVVGSAEIVVRAITDGLKKDIKDALKDLRPVVAKEGQKAGKIYSDSFNEGMRGQLGDGLGDSLRDATRDATDGIPDIVDDVMDDVEDNMEDGGRRGGNAFGRGFLRSKFANSAIAASKAFTTVFAIGNVVGAGVSALVGVLSALVSSLFSVAASASQAAGALGVLPGIYTSIAQAAGVAKLAISGVGDAFKAGITAEDAGTKASELSAAAAELAGKKGKAARELAVSAQEAATAANEEFNKALSKLSPAAQSFVKYLIEVKDQFKVIKLSAQEGLFPGVEEALRAIVESNTIEKIATGFQRTGELVGEAAAGIADMFALGAKNNLTKFLEANNRIIEVFVDRGGAGENVLTKLVRLFIRLRLAVQPVTERFAIWIASLIRGAAWATNTAEEVDNLAEFFNKAGDRAALLGDIGKNLIGIFINLGKAASPAGTGLLKSFRAYTRELRNTTNVKQDNLRRYFRDVAETLRSVANLTRAIGRGLADLGDNNGLRGFVDGLQPAVQSFTNIGNAMASAGPDMAIFISQIAEILEAFADTEALQLFFEILNSVLGVIIDFVKTDFGGWLLATVGTIAAVTRSIGLMRTVAVLAFKILIGGTLSAARSFDTLTRSVTRTRVALTQSQAYSTATTRMGRLSAAAGIAATKLRTMVGPALRTAGPLAALAIASNDSTRNIEGSSVAIGALTGAMLGPWGAAAGGAIGLIQEISSSSGDASGAIDTLRESIEKGLPPLKIQADEAAAREEVENFRHNVENAWGSEGMNLEAGFQWSKNALDGLFTGRDEIGDLEASLDEATEAGDKYTRAIRQARIEQRRFADGYVDMVDRVGLSAVAVSEDFKALTRAINVQQEAMLNSLDADFALANTLRDVDKRVKEGKKGFDENTEAGYTNYQTLLSVAAALNRTKKPYKDKVEQLREVARSMGASKERTQEFILALLKVPKKKQFDYSVKFDRDRLTDALRLIKDLPKDAQTFIRQKGIPESVKEIDKLVKKYELSEKDRETLVELKDKASGTIDTIKDKLKDLDGTTAQVGINILVSHPNLSVGDIFGGLLSGPGGTRPPRGGPGGRLPSPPAQDGPGRVRIPDGFIIPGSNDQDRGRTVINIDRVEAHDYSDFVAQLERRRRRRGLGGY